MSLVAYILVAALVFGGLGWLASRVPVAGCWPTVAATLVGVALTVPRSCGGITPLPPQGGCRNAILGFRITAPAWLPGSPDMAIDLVMLFATLLPLIGAIALWRWLASERSP